MDRGDSERTRRALRHQRRLFGSRMNVACWPTAGTHHRQQTGSLITVPMLTIATSKLHHLRLAIDPSCSEAPARDYRRPANSRRSPLKANLSLRLPAASQVLQLDDSCCRHRTLSDPPL